MSGVIVTDKYGHVQSRNQGASHSIRDVRDWTTWLASADADLIPELGTLTARTRDLQRNSGVAAGYAATVCDNVIGPSLKLTATPNHVALGFSEQWASEWSAVTEAHWRPFAQSTSFDIERRLTFHSMAAMVLQGEISNGGAVVIPRWKPNRAGVRYSTCFQIIEVDRLCNPRFRPDTDRLHGGIEYDRDGAPVAAHIRNKTGGEYLGYYDGPYEWERVPFYTAWGRPKIFHCFQPTRAGQTKGAPKFASVLREFKSLSRYTQAELNSAVSHALATFFVKSNLGSEMMVSMFGDNTETYLDSRKEITSLAKSDLHSVTMEDNVIIPLMPGDEIVDPRSSRPNDQFEPFIRANLRRIAAGLGVSYELLMRDFSATNYSSARAALLLDQKSFAGKLQWLLTYFARPAYSTWLEEAIDRGDVDGEGFYEYREAYTNCRITGAGRGHIDPLKEAKASTEKLTNGTGTLNGENAEQGGDWEENMDQRAKEFKRALSIVEDNNLPEVFLYILAGVQPPGQFALASEIDPDAGPGAPAPTNTPEQDAAVEEIEEAA